MGKMFYSCAILHLIILLILEFAIATNTTSFGCISREMKALLKLKASFTDPSNRLASWNSSTDCCSWKGVVCDKNKGHVISLHLRNTDPFIERGSYGNWLASNHLDSSLLGLKYLSYLDLSFNNFQYSPIPAFLGSMKQLQHLNFSNANFSGVVPHSLRNLSSLRVLDLNQARYDSNLMVDDLTWASNLSLLEHLDMSGVDLSGTKHLSEVLFHMLPSILVLRLSYSHLRYNTHLSHSCVNSSLVTNIQHLDLSSNFFEGEFPCFLRNMTSLRVLDLSGNNYSSFSPHALLTLTNLVHLDLLGNWLHHKVDWISEILFGKCHLKSLNLAVNRFYGELSGRLFRNLSMGYCWTHKLETLDLSDNQFYGHLPEEMGDLKQLNLLDLSENAFSGPFPTSIGKLRALRYLLLFDNQLSGEIPTSIGKLRALRELLLSKNHLSGEFPISLGQLSNLEKIDISSNFFTSTLSEAHFANLSMLEVLHAYNNFINFSVRFDWVPPFQLKKLYIQSNRIGDGQFPQWLQTQKALELLDMSNCSILGTLPEWLHYLNLTDIGLSHNMINGSIRKLPPYLETLDLSHNMMNGPMRELPAYLKTLDLSHNMMSGSIPDSLCQLKALGTLDLSKNYFSGNLPNCWADLQGLHFLRLSSNTLSGVIPNSIGEAGSLILLNLSNNSLTGQLPATLKNCTSLENLDVGENMLSGNLPHWIGSHMHNLKVLRLRKNEFNGVIPSTFCQLFNLQVMDLANNTLTGDIPNCFGNFFGMNKDSNLAAYYAAWSDETLRQVIKGVELEYTTTSIFVTNLDLSSNNLVGEIPWQLTNLSGLIGLNLSHNHLGGEIPTNIGDMKSLISLDLSSNNLRGPIPHSLSDLNFLTSLNLSHNNLSGPIPTGRQLQTIENPSIYEGNPGLCGAPLLKKCHDDGTSKSPNVDENDGGEEEDDRHDKIIFYAVIVSGFATGFWGIIGVLVVKRSWRLAFFQFAEDTIRKMLGI